MFLKQFVGARQREDEAHAPPVTRAYAFKRPAMDGTPSYVELLTCLEMARDAQNVGGLTDN
jgi:hypothetical protein